jgi:hypothetical protein
MISEGEVSKLVNDAQLYEIVLNKESCLQTYNRMMYAHKVKTAKKELLKLLVEKAKEAYEAEQAKVASEECNQSSQLAETVATAN